VRKFTRQQIVQNVFVLKKPMILGGKPEFADSSLPSSAPWSGRELGAICAATDAQVEAALHLAEKAYRSPMPLEERLAVCSRASIAILRRKLEFVELLIEETGKPRQFADSEVERMSATFYLASQAGDAMHKVGLDLSFDRRGAGFFGKWQRFAVGPILGFVPYNWPLNLAAHKLAPAIVAGCPIVMKVSPLAPLCTLALGELLIECGMQPESLSVMHLSNDQAQKMLTDPRIRMLSFTGSPSVGWMLKERVPRKRVALELGGNAPVIICEDADLPLAVSRTALSGYAYAGQVCISAQNVFVQEKVFNEALSMLADATVSCKTGDPGLDDTVCGPLIDDSARNRVLDRIERSGAKVVARAKSEDHPLLVPPTLLTDVDPKSDVFCEEIFGPVLNVVSFERIEGLVDELNRGRYRLQASIFTSNQETAEFAFRSLQYGGVVVNESPSLRFDNMPYGGEGDSGFGREGVRFAIEEMTTPRTGLIRRG
jgi:acyl-CoA reductase-like NAD-dependent aldehyde dehydrogenase